MVKTGLAVVMVVGAWLGLPALAGAQTSDKQPTAGKTQEQKAVSAEDIDLMRKDLRSEKKQLVAQNLNLTDAEATKFWPIYDQYTAELTKIYDRKAAVIKEYAASQETMTDDQALKLIKQWQDADIAGTQLLEKYIPVMAGAIGGKKAAKFGQIDRRITLIVEVQLASQIPMIKTP
jgi:hypothetical protein